MLLFKKILACVNKSSLRNESDDFRPSYPQAPCLGSPAYLLKCLMQGSDIDISDVHRYLGNTVFIYEPAYCLATLESAGNHDGLAVFILYNLSGNRIAFSLGTPFFPYVKCDCIGASC